MNKISRVKLAKAYVQLLPAVKQADLTKALARIVVENRLTSQLDLLMEDVRSELLRQYGHGDVEVASAFKLSGRIEDEIKSAVGNLINAKSITVNSSIDKELIGGAMVHGPDFDWDFTIKNKLKKLVS